jgi:cephalosporin hydroxylase
MNKMNIDLEANTVQIDDEPLASLYSPEGFRAISDLWLSVGWDQKYMYTFSWFGRPIIQIPDDMIRMQEVIYAIKPDVIIETGVAHGGSLIYYATLCKAMDQGRIIGVDLEIRPHNRKAIEEHELSHLVTLIEGDSTATETLREVREKVVSTDEVVLVILDSAHDYAHVAAELQAYSDHVTIGSYIVVTDGSQALLGETQRAKLDYPEYCETWKTNNPMRATHDFVAENDDFRLVEPEFPFSESDLDFRVTNWPSAFVKRIKQ